MKSLLPLLLLTAVCAGGEAPLPEKVDYNRDVRPILSDLCFKCHGFDDKAREAGRRLDTSEGALADQEGVRAIDPGKPDASEVHLRIHSTEKDEAMPPLKSGKKLSERQKLVIDRWIEQGAPYARHWSFEPVRPVTPPVTQAAPTGNPIDAFIRARLEREGLAPAPDADPVTLCRRLCLDLTGVPPTPEEADRFAEAARADLPVAVAALADRLLASPQYGERWARRWLDLARYADTNGYEKDRPRSIWPWRDWVISALNADMPFDQFTTEQLAGDLLPEATPAQLIATGFHRNTMLNEEGGIDPLEYRYLSLTDRVATTGTTWLGLTVGCAQCHTHKYDPILHREYYQMMAFFNNADEPQYTVPPPDLAAKRAAMEAGIAKAMAALPEHFRAVEKGAPTLAEAYARWLESETAAAVQWQILRPASAHSNLPLLTVLEDDSVLASGDQTKTDTYELTFRSGLAHITAVRLEALPDERLPAGGPGRVYYEGPAGDFTLTNFTAAADGTPCRMTGATQSFAMAKFTAAEAIDDNLQTGWSINGGQGKEHHAIFRFAQPLEGIAELKLALQFARHYAAGLGRFRISVTDDPRELAARATPPEIERLLVVPEENRTAEQRQKLYEHFLLTAPELASGQAQIAKLRKTRENLPTTLVFRERPPENPRPTFLHRRGEFLQPAEEVHPAVFSALPPLPPGAKPDRLAFARWLVAPENPLTARVTVNRQWAILFGRGLVKTTEDFGLQGSPPTHPELLDWLAGEFVREGWSLKKLHRLIVTSATYRQSSRVTPEVAARDPENQLLAHGPRGRLEAEQVRDATLFAAGLLSLKMGGPSVYPPQPEGVAEVAYGGAKWTTSTGEDRFRRGLYTFAKRTAPYAMFNTFDGPTGESCLARRETSNNPLQALTLLNDVVLVEAAQALGKSLAAAPGSVEERVRKLFRRVLTRAPTEEEATLLTAFLKKQEERFGKDEAQARALAGETGAGLAERAAWTALARAVFNLDEAITRS